MLLAKTFTTLVSPVQQPTIIVETSDRPFKPRIQPATGSSVMQSTGPVTQLSSSQTQPTTDTSDPSFMNLIVYNMLIYVNLIVHNMLFYLK